LIHLQPRGALICINDPLRIRGVLTDTMIGRGPTVETLLYFALFAGLFFFMVRFGCGAHVMGHRHRGHTGHERSGSVPPTGAGRRQRPRSIRCAG
jgi:hypothetical protein